MAAAQPETWAHGQHANFELVLFYFHLSALISLGQLVLSTNTLRVVIGFVTTPRKKPLKMFDFISIKLVLGLPHNWACFCY